MTQYRNFKALKFAALQIFMKNGHRRSKIEQKIKKKSNKIKLIHCQIIKHTNQQRDKEGKNL